MLTLQLHCFANLGVLNVLCNVMGHTHPRIRVSLDTAMTRTQPQNSMLAGLHFGSEQGTC